jgi:hypothetical protein
MYAAIRNLLAVTALGLFSLTSTGADTHKDSKVAVKAEKAKTVQEAHTLDGKKPKACDFRISLS